MSKSLPVIEWEVYLFVHSQTAKSILCCFCTVSWSLMTGGVIRSSNLTSCELQAIASNLDSPQWLWTEAFISSGKKKPNKKLLGNCSWKHKKWKFHKYLRPLQWKGMLAMTRWASDYLSQGSSKCQIQINKSSQQLWKYRMEQARGNFSPRHKSVETLLWTLISVFLVMLARIRKKESLNILVHLCMQEISFWLME